ncbi:hypothetical protein KQX54_000472 [Cotesia glomerata]|uniref:Uncharacterized protein n=1 Tax=Cotesia glomerata TaxID=32391 RepID=A0AAV7IBU8_COTGL|nr:hypothetical protein KQX54_000472 [Cotesia glomerata]
MDDIELETMNLTWDENFIFLMENWTRLKNMSEEEYLEYQLGPKHLSLSVVVPITVVNNESLTMCTGFNALQFRRVKMRLSNLKLVGLLLGSHDYCQFFNSTETFNRN